MRGERGDEQGRASRRPVRLMRTDGLGVRRHEYGGCDAQGDDGGIVEESVARDTRGRVGTWWCLWLVSVTRLALGYSRRMRRMRR